MVRRETYINKIRTLGYEFKRQADKVCMYKRPGNPDFIGVARRDLLDEDWVRSTLVRAGLTVKEAEQFIGANRVN